MNYRAAKVDFLLMQHGIRYEIYSQFRMHKMLVFLNYWLTLCNLTFEHEYNSHF